MTPSSTELATALATEARKHLAAEVGKIRHCLGQLSDDQVWWRPAEMQNSIANLILHLGGNVGQWVVAGIGGAPDVRNRPLEFTERGPFPKAELLRRLEEVVAQADAALAAMTPEEWLTPRRIQGFDATALAAVFRSLTHFTGHTQEIIHLTRQQLGDAYRFAGMPPEGQKAASN